MTCKLIVPHQTKPTQMLIYGDVLQQKPYGYDKVPDELKPSNNIIEPYIEKHILGDL